MLLFGMMYLRQTPNGNHFHWVSSAPPLSDTPAIRITLLSDALPNEKITSDRDGRHSYSRWFERCTARRCDSAIRQYAGVLAGAGSGKTRVLTHRIAWQIQTQNMSPYSVLAVTFTNKAAAEMRSRIERLLAMPVRGMWVGTFHGIAHRLLRTHFAEAGLPQNFQILDADDQLRLVKRVISSLDLDEKKWPARQAVWFINGQKDEGRRPQHIPDEEDLYVRTHVAIYEAYELALERGGMIDFAEMLLRSHELWREHPALLRHYQDRFHSLLVDEFQDTNTIQYALSLIHI